MIDLVPLTKRQAVVLAMMSGCGIHSAAYWGTTDKMLTAIADRGLLERRLYGSSSRFVYVITEKGEALVAESRTGKPR